MRKELELQIVSPEFIIEDATKNFCYLESDWKKQAQNFIEKYKAKNFYYAAPDGVYSYPRYYVEYITPDGLMLFTPFQLGGMLTNRGFKKIFILKLDTEESVQVVNMIFGSGHTVKPNGVIICSDLFYSNGVGGRAEKTPANRRMLAENKILVSSEF